MTEYIKKNDAEDIIESVLNSDYDWYSAVCDAYSEIENLTPEKVKEDVRGEWLTIKNDDVYVVRCSCCGREAILFPNDTGGAYLMSDYCPWCGADLRGTKNE